MTRRTARRRSFAPAPALALALAGAMVVAGCQSGGARSPSPSPSVSSSSASPTASPSPSPSPTEGAIPAAAKVQSEEGAEAFARFYIARSAEAWTTPDSTLIEGLATPDCQTCANLLKTAKELEAKGQRYSSTPVKVVSMSRFRGGSTEWVFDTKLREQAVKILDKSGSEVASYPARDLSPAVSVVWQRGRWWIDGIGD